jgi:hypothetical protein
LQDGASFLFPDEYVQKKEHDQFAETPGLYLAS